MTARLALCLTAAALASQAAGNPIDKAIHLFTAGGIPATGPAEAAAPARNWPDPAAAPDVPGRGLAQHPMLFAGEGYNMLFVVDKGKVVWTYSTGQGGEIDDVWMLTNGHILFTTQFHVFEVTPRKEIVWHYDAPAGTEVHTCQPIGLDKVMLVQNGLPPKLIIVNKKTGAVETERALPAPSETDPKTVHPQFRRARITAQGTYLAAHLNMNKVVEYDKDFKPIWTYEIPSPWSAVRLQNGNTLIDDERERLVREVNPRGETVWEFRLTDLPAGLSFGNNQTADRLANGNTVIFCSTGGAKREDRPNRIQAVEVTPDKKVAWVLQDWKNLGPATTAQFLDEPGVPEHPGEIAH
ncbi:MAG TPA: hypothetical protein VKB88_19385 [Bryobacteraceae bacterium]|nr:hypothetical protein [Bryobacteraceae bacterium]